MRRLYVSKKIEEVFTDARPSILVGQRCHLSSSVSSFFSETGSYVAYVVAECVPCEDASVVEEQVECLERVLPFGIEVLGVSGGTSAVAELAAQLHSKASKTWLRVVCSSGSSTAHAFHRLGAPCSNVEVVTTEVTFVEVRVALHSCECAFPLLVSSPGASPCIVDGESGVALKDEAPSLTSTSHVVQLGAAKSILRLHVVLDPAYMSAKGLYDVLRRQINAALAAGATRLVEVQSHNAHVSYCCRVEVTAASAATQLASAEEANLSPKVLGEVFEMIEDATGVAAKHSDVRECASVVSSNRGPVEKKPVAAPANAKRNAFSVSKKSGSDTVRLLVGLFIVIIGAVVVIMQ